MNCSRTAVLLGKTENAKNGVFLRHFAGRWKERWLHPILASMAKVTGLRRRRCYHSTNNVSAGGALLCAVIMTSTFSIINHTTTVLQQHFASAVCLIRQNVCLSVSLTIYISRVVLVMQDDKN